jgi:hypothetical protein
MGPKNNSGKNLEKTAGKKMGGDDVGTGEQDEGPAE